MVDFSDIRYVDEPVLAFYPPYEFTCMCTMCERQGIEITGTYYKPREITKQYPEWESAREQARDKYLELYECDEHPMVMCGFLSNIDPQWLFEKIRFFCDDRVLDPDFKREQEEMKEAMRRETEEMIADGRIVIPPHLA